MPSLWDKIIKLVRESEARIKVPGDELLFTDDHGIEWIRTDRIDAESTYEDNYYYIPVECHCDTDVGAGYTMSDEHGSCDFCLFIIRQVNGHNDAIELSSEEFTRMHHRRMK